MSKGERIALWLLAAYVIIAIFTFGHAAAHYPKCIETETHICVGGDAAMAGLAAAFAWPLYWSWEAWS